MAKNDLHSVILSVRQGRRNLATAALGTSMTGVPATTSMHFRIGSVAIAYLSTLLLRLRDQGRLRLNDRLSRWFPALPHASQITLAMLAETTSGYADYVAQPSFVRALYADPFRQWAPRELLAIGTNPRLFTAPGKFRYAHTNFILLGEVLSKVTGTPLATLMRQNIFRPLGLRRTAISSTPQIPSPGLHAFDSERGRYEESTFWSPSWTLGTGAIMTSNISDLARSAAGIGSGKLLSRRSYRDQVAHISRLGPGAYFGMGVFNINNWIVQNPLFSGYNAIMAYLPSRHITIAVSTTLGPNSSASTNYSTDLAKTISAYLTPRDPIG
jgi:CubicO group peptidase (beta-lactamase class C family)